ncbi:hypothetical protein AC578_5439 [Pseudocercospora eumusae]|uniref:Thioesterase domain-containing protein n=1 Tax=Pseudocercospora eumusae TaxID=321146 RepID=A0A139HK00_9PEZI|nr:hypothetical protein AC578_5439 [Pseudocercospora eumusae]KXT02735.1 hypothetical protein AC578_5439 [Pseudocercospora eumusae]KXT02736.1 hypothetical protein AC578_5439 [Pseudocercospora eumusae]
MADKQALAAVEAFRAQYLAHTSDANFDRKMWEHLDIISASATKETVSFAISIPIVYSNHLGMVQGGAIATLFDGLTSSALALLGPGLLWSGKEVSRSLHCKFFKPVPVEERIDAYISVVRADSRTATILTYYAEGILAQKLSCQIGVPHVQAAWDFGLMALEFSVHR